MSSISNNRTYVTHRHQVLFISKHLDKSGCDEFVKHLQFLFPRPYYAGYVLKNIDGIFLFFDERIYLFSFV